MGVSMVVIGMMNYLTEFGMSEVITQREDLSSYEINYIFWFATSMGIILSTLCFSISGLIEQFFDKDGVKEILQVLSIVLFFKSLTVVPYKLMERKFKFKIKAALDLVSKTLSLVAAVIFASIGMGVWSLVYAQIIWVAMLGIFSFIVEPFCPNFRFRFSEIPEMTSFGFKIILLRSLWYLRSQIDKIIGGKFLPIQIFGYYTFAFQLCRSIHTVIHSVTNTITVPVLARLQKDEEKLNKAFLFSVRYISIVTLPLYVGGSFMSNDLIKILLPAKWLPSAPVFSVACIVMIYHMMNAIYENLYIAKGKPQYSIIMNGCISLVFGGGFLFSVRWGVNGLLVAWMVLYPIIYIGWTIFTLKNCRIKFCDYLDSIMPALIGSGAMLLALFFLKYLIFGDLNDLGRLTLLPYFIFNLTFAALIYICVLFFKFRPVIYVLLNSKGLDDED